MKIYLKIDEVKEGKQTVDVLGIVPNGSQPSPYPDNYLGEVSDDTVFSNDFFDAGVAVHSIDVELIAVKNSKGEIVKASHPDETKNGKFDLYEIKAVTPVYMKSPTVIASDPVRLANIELKKQKEYEANVDRLTLEHYRKSLLKYPEAELEVIAKKIADASVIVKGIK